MDERDSHYLAKPHLRGTVEILNRDSHSPFLLFGETTTTQPRERWRYLIYQIWGIQKVSSRMQFG